MEGCRQDLEHYGSSDKGQAPGRGLSLFAGPSCLHEDATLALVVMPELIVRGTDRLLHNQRALYLKRLLLFEPRVILASVPYQLL